VPTNKDSGVKLDVPASGTEVQVATDVPMGPEVQSGPEVGADKAPTPIDLALVPLDTAAVDAPGIDSSSVVDAGTPDAPVGIDGGNTVDVQRTEAHPTVDGGAVDGGSVG